MRKHTSRRRKPLSNSLIQSEFQLDFQTSISDNVLTEGEGAVTLSPSSQNRGIGSAMTTLETIRREQACQTAFGDEIRPSCAKTERKTYSQIWPAYNAAQTSEKDNFLTMLADLCASIEQPEYTFGRPSYPIADMMFAAALKVYTKFPARRFDSDIREVHTQGFIDILPSFNTVNRAIKDPEMTPIITDLIERSAAPLNVLESQFAVDASGFSTSRFDRWYDHKWGKERKQQHWLKAHILSGTKTNVIASIAITDSAVHDTKMFPYLLERASKQFTLKEVSADKGYLSDDNFRLIEKLDAVPYIPFKKNTTGKGSARWRRLYRYFMLNEEEWAEHYHRRSNVETTFSMVKSKFDGSVRAKSDTGMVNEILLKFLCHNICVLNQEIHEVAYLEGLQPDPTLC